MKKIDDKEIINTVRNDSDYKIKTTSASILRKYHAQKNEALEKKKSKTKYFVFGGFGVLAASAAVIATVFFVSNGSGNDTGKNPLNPNITIKNKTLKHELATFSLFSNEENKALVNNLIKMRKSAEEDEEAEEEKQNSVTQELFKDLCVTYDSANQALDNLNRETKIEGTEFNDKVNGSDTTYKYKNVISYVDSGEQIATIYLNDETIFEEDDDEFESKIEGLYLANDQAFELTIEKEIETDETEYVLTFMPKFESDYYYVVEKEQEIDGSKKEEAYSYSTCNKNQIEDEFVEKIAYEKEEKNGKVEFELEVEKNNGEKKYQYKDVIITNYGSTFKGSIDGNNNDSLDEIKVAMTYEGTARLYKYDTFSVLLK